MPGGNGQTDDGQGTDEPDEAKRKSGPGPAVNLPPNRDAQHLASDYREEIAGQEEAEAPGTEGGICRRGGHRKRKAKG